MSKRFTETDKWKDPWFRRLPCKYKSFWEYLRDNCDQAGFWKVDLDYAAYHIGENLERKEVLEQLNNGKIRVVDHGEHWELADFVGFQNGPLKESCKPHRPIIKLLEKYKKKGYRKGINTLEVKEKERVIR